MFQPNAFYPPQIEQIMFCLPALSTQQEQWADIQYWPNQSILLMDL